MPQVRQLIGFLGWEPESVCARTVSPARLGSLCCTWCTVTSGAGREVPDTSSGACAVILSFHSPCHPTQACPLCTGAGPLSFHGACPHPGDAFAAKAVASPLPRLPTMEIPCGRVREAVCRGLLSALAYDLRSELGLARMDSQGELWVREASQ